MAPSDDRGWRARWHAYRDRWAARRAWLSRRDAALAHVPEPRALGDPGRGARLVEGRYLFAGYRVDAPGTSLWDLPPPDAAFEAALHGFRWLDDLAALGTPAAETRMRDWTHDWVRRYGTGRGPGWTPSATGARLSRLIEHAEMLGASGETGALDRSLVQQATFLSRRWRATRGPGRIEALAALIAAGTHIEGLERLAERAAAAMAREAGSQIDAGGAIPSRNPEALLAVVLDLDWAAAALRRAGLSPRPGHAQAVVRAVPVLRALRHADGGLARFHGGGRGDPGHLDAVLAESGVRARHDPSRLTMGYARLAHGRTSVIVDAAPPPRGSASVEGHACTLAFELTSGRRPLIVNCGAGHAFGARWRRAGRSTPSHSTLGLDGYSSARIGAGLGPAGTRTAPLFDGPREVTVQMAVEDGAATFLAGHDGYAPSHGLTHVRELALALSGRVLAGADLLQCVDRAGARRFEQVARRSGRGGIPFAIRFHLHPDVTASHDPGGEIVLTLPSDERWSFAAERAAPSIEPGVYLERGRLSPRASLQIVLSGRAETTSTRIDWTLSKTDDTPVAVRDLASTGAPA